MNISNSIFATFKFLESIHIQYRNLETNDLFEQRFAFKTPEESIFSRSTGVRLLHPNLDLHLEPFSARISCTTIFRSFSNYLHIIFDRRGWVFSFSSLPETPSGIRDNGTWHTSGRRLARPSRERFVSVDLDSFELFIETRETENSC